MTPTLSERLRWAKAIVDSQAEDDGLWFIAETITEAYFQQELRRLHVAVEAAASALDAQEQQIAALRATLAAVASAGVEMDDPRIDYVVVQIDRTTWTEVRALLTPSMTQEQSSNRRHPHE